MVDADSGRQVKKPRSGYKRAAVETEGKFKKGYAPLLNAKESTEFVDGLFGMSSLALGSHWALEEEEAELLGEKLHKVLEKFPVKIQQDAEMLAKIIAIYGLTTTAIGLTLPRVRQTMEGKKNNVTGKFTAPKTASGNGTAANEQRQRNAAPPNGAGETYKPSFSFGNGELEGQGNTFSN